MSIATAMKLLYFVDQWPSLFQIYFLREIQWMRERGHSVSLISLNSAPNAFKSETKDYIDLAEFHLQDVPVLHLDSQQMTLDRMVGEALSFARLHRAQLIDAHTAREPAELACQVYLASGIPYCVRMRGGDVYGKTSPRLAEILHYASAVCPMSQFLVDVLVGARILKDRVIQGIPAKVNHAKLQVIPNSLPRAYLAPAPVSQRSDLQVVGVIGRAMPGKRHWHIIEAVAGLVSAFPGLQLKIIGGGPMLPDLRALASQMGIADRFEITGFKPWAEVMALARQLHIYVQASVTEGCSLATIEAAFQGIPLLLSRIGANEQCVEPGINGYLFDSGDINALRENLRLLLLAGAARREQMGKATLDIVGSRFSEENIMPQVEAMYQDVIDSSPRSKELSLAAN